MNPYGKRICIRCPKHKIHPQVYSTDAGDLCLEHAYDHETKGGDVSWSPDTEWTNG